MHVILYSILLNILQNVTKIFKDTPLFEKKYIFVVFSLKSIYSFVTKEI